METALWVSIGIVVLGVVLSYLFARRKTYRDPSSAVNYDKKKNESIEHYKKIRDKVSLRELKEQEEEVEYESGGFSLMTFIKGLITTGITVLIGITIFPQINEALASASVNMTDANNVTLPGFEFTQTMFSMVPIIFTITILIVIVATLYNAFRKTDII